MFIKRVMTALVGIPAAIYIINTGQGVFAAAVTLLTLVAWHEFSGIMRFRGIRTSYPLGTAGVLALIGCAWLGNSQETVAVIVGVALAATALPVIRPTHTVETAVFTVFGVAYVGLPFAHLLLLRATDSSFSFVTGVGSLSAGAAYLWLAFIGTWASDTFAYFVGTRWGRRKMCPAVSPGKTWEGAAGGLAGGLLGVLGAAHLFNIPYAHGAAIGVLVVVAAGFGDLAESALKRYAGVKDSGRILPGHGGVLDRFDSIMFAVPAVYYYVQAFLLQ